MKFIFPVASFLKEPVGDDMIFALRKKDIFNVSGLRLLHLGLWRGRINSLYTLNKVLPNLAEFYRQYQARNTICLAPDLALRAWETRRAWEMWHEEENRPAVVPVVQPGSKFNNAMYDILAQVDYYARWYRERGKVMRMICLGNSLVRAAEVRNVIPILTQMIRRRGVEYIHILGAGWDMEDILNWAILGVDSIDSTSYYTSAEEGRRWFLQGGSCIYDVEMSKAELTWHNAECIKVALAQI